MNVQTEINWIISELSKVKDPELINAFKSMLKYREKHVRKDWWDEIPASVKESIEVSLKQADEGNTISHDEVMSEVRLKYGL